VLTVVVDWFVPLLVSRSDQDCLAKLATTIEQQTPTHSPKTHTTKTQQPNAKKPKTKNTQIQDDVLDCYGDPAVIGKVGTDIEDAKCCWLVCTALDTASEEQKEAIKANYGRKDPESVAAVKKVYEELGLKAKFEAYEAESHARLTKRVAEQKLLPEAVFTNLLAKIYKRQK
jgi:hypothetical protein